jgi:cytosine/adenosine deaminase-related metal-dependent hydrolase
MPSVEGPMSDTKDPITLSRREWLAGAGVGVAAMLLNQQAVDAQAPQPRTVVFTRTTVVNVDSVQRDVAVAVVGDLIAAIGPTEQIVTSYPRADVYDGRGKALIPGLINCHSHLTATIERGFNEDFGFPNAARLPVQPSSLLSDEETTLMATVGALEGLRSGSTTIVQSASNIASTAPALAKTGLRMVFAEAIRDRENGSGPMSPEKLTSSEPPRFSPRLRDQGMQRIDELFSKWHGSNGGRINVFPAATLAEDASPELLKAVREFAEKHDLGYTIHLTQSVPEADFMVRYHGVRPAVFLDRSGFLGPRLFAAHCRYCDQAEIDVLGRSKTIVSHQAAMASNRGVIPPIPALRAAGCPIALGTDNNTNDIFEVMRVALMTERIRRDDARPGLRPQPEDMLEDATQGGARAVRFEKLSGTLEVGRKADLLVLDTQRIHLVPAMRVLSAWIHNGQPSDIESVMVDGQFVMRDRKILAVDEAAIIAEADKVGRRVWDRVLAAGPVPIPGRPPQR